MLDSFTSYISNFYDSVTATEQPSGEVPYDDEPPEDRHTRQQQIATSADDQEYTVEQREDAPGTRYLMKVRSCFAVSCVFTVAKYYLRTALFHAFRTPITVIDKKQHINTPKLRMK